MPLDSFLTDEVMQAIATDNNLAETAFLVRDGDDYLLRWFTPTVEGPLCGHATLANAAVVMERLEPGRHDVVFHTASGALAVRRTGGAYVVNYPVRLSKRIVPPPHLAAALGVVPTEVHADAFNYLALLDSAEVVRTLAPAKGIPEDPVTGSAHCALTLFWANRLGKTAFRAYQASRWGGEMLCRLVDNRVELEGSCIFYLEGEVEV